MAEPTRFDNDAGHKHFSQQCFNRAWDLMEKTNRTDQENLEMVQLAQASVWHWSQREDCTNQNLSIGCWQVSRIYSLLGEVDNARKYGALSLGFSRDETPFLKGYAYEALARAELLAGNHSGKENYLRQARELTETITDANEKSMLQLDLESIE